VVSTDLLATQFLTQSPFIWNPLSCAAYPEDGGSRFLKTLPYTYQTTVELGYNVVKETERFVSLETSVVITENNNVMVKRGINWYDRIYGTTDGVSYKQMS
jgi:hypothetical protein